MYITRATLSYELTGCNIKYALEVRSVVALFIVSYIMYAQIFYMTILQINIAMAKATSGMS